MADQHVTSTPKGSHVSFSQNIDYEATPTARLAMHTHTTSAAPSTPPQSNKDLPTPPNSHIEMATWTQPRPPQHDSQQALGHASTSQTAPNDPGPLPEATDESPSVHVHQRRAKRVSAGSSTALNEAASSQPVSERHTVLAEAQRGRSRGRSGRAGQDETSAGSESSRSRTPSPILGSTLDSNGHLSFAASLVPSAEEVQSLLYGWEDGKTSLREEDRPKEVKRDDMESLLDRLALMGFANVEQREGATNVSQEEELAGMVKKLVTHARLQEKYIDGMEETLHDTRIRSISLLTSLRTTFAHTLASEYSLRARVEAELDGSRTQAKKLSAMLAKSESRNEEIDRERAMSAEEEVLWQEEMKDHASAYAQQQAARARAAQMAQAQSSSHGQKTPNMEPVKTEATAAEHSGVEGETSPVQVMLKEPFEERKADENAVTGLGISSVATEHSVQISTSPLSTIVKERNKLLSDKRYLKSRIRDAEAQRDRLEVELKNLRPLLVRGAPSKIAASASQATMTTPSLGQAPLTPGRSHKRDRSRRRRQATMGDAESEHLLLAARRLRDMNKSRYGYDEGRPRTPPPGSSIQPRTPKTPRTALSYTPRSTAGRDMMDSVYQSNASSRMTDQPLLPHGSPLSSRNTGTTSLGRWGTHERVDSAMSGSGIDDLLQAAQTVLTPEKKAAHRQSHSRSKGGQGVQDSDEEGRDEEGSAAGEDGLSSQRSALLPAASAPFSSKDLGPLNESPKRRRVSSAAVDLERSRNSVTLSPDKRGAIFQRGRRVRTNTEGAEPLMHSFDRQTSALDPMQSQSSAGLSALDLLADQAAASQQPSQSSDPSHSGEGEANMDPDDVYGSEDEGMAVDEEEDRRPMTEARIGSHYYPRGAYGHSYAQQPSGTGGATSAMGHDGYRSGYTYAPVGSSPVLPLSSQGWTSQNASSVAPRNGIYAPRGTSPGSNTSRFAAAYHNGPRISTGHVSQHHNPVHSNGNGSQHDDSHANNRTPQKGGNTSPDKRLPYVRWSDEEDQKLRKAIAEYGQRWESVARVVGTRSYHQCRQRYLLMRRKEAAAREGTANEDSRPASHLTAGAH